MFEITGRTIYGVPCERYTDLSHHTEVAQSAEVWKWHIAAMSPCARPWGIDRPTCDHVLELVDQAEQRGKQVVIAPRTVMWSTASQPPAA
jgi:hypothetical protein